MKTFRILSILVLSLGILGFAACAYAGDVSSFLGWLSLGALGAAFAMRDALLKVTKALPAAASSSVTSTAIDTAKGAFGDQVADFEFLLTAPALTTTMLPDTRTATYIIEHDTDPAFGTVTTLVDNAIVQTGAGGVGAATATKRFRVPTDAKRYIRAKCTLGASTTDSSAVSLTLEVLV